MSSTNSMLYSCLMNNGIKHCFLLKTTVYQALPKIALQEAELMFQDSDTVALVSPQMIYIFIDIPKDIETLS